MQTLKNPAEPNEACPCGSGKKYKRCCGTREMIQAQARRGQMKTGFKYGAVAVIAIAALFSVFIIAGLRKPETVPPPPPRPPAQRAAVPGSPPPPGPPPAGKVWNTEHGHYHDAPAMPPMAPMPGAQVPPPEGPAPEGKVWDPAHGHYHDEPGAAPGAAPVVETAPAETAPAETAPTETAPAAAE